MLAEEALDKVLTMDFRTVLDIGSGRGLHSYEFLRHSKEVTTVSLEEPAHIIGDYNDQIFYEKFDCIWASHVLEHQRNPGEFLEKCYKDLKDDGILAITVPPRKDIIVGGHVTLWNAGLLLYNLILAGFDCSEASVKTYGYNVSVIVKKKLAVHGNLAMGRGDIEKLAHLFPMDVEHGFDGNIQEINW